jgi:sulfur carrier protein
VIVNGEAMEPRVGETVAELVARMGLDPLARGVAVAIDGEVLPRGGWCEHVLGSDARVEILAAMQGG